MIKTTIISLLLVLAITKIQAQDYLISFNAIGDTSVVTTVYVENLTSGATLVLNGSDILHLTPVTGIADPDFANRTLQIYPNPMAGQSELKFDASTDGNAVIKIVDLSGKTVCKFNKSVTSGVQTFRISGIKPGMYLLKVEGKNYSYSSKLVSQVKFQGEARIEYISTIKNTINKQLKSITSTIEMPYAEGDVLLYKITSGKYSTVITDVPSGSKTITSNFVSCTDADNNSYSTVKIGEQVWMAENLKSTRYNDGTAIPRETDNTAWQTLSTPAIAWLNNDSAAYQQMYGVLYNGFAVGTGKLAPKGWHVPTDAEWDTLVTYLGGKSVAGGKLKEIGTSHWVSPNTGATNEFGFSALPASVHEGGGIPGFGLTGRSAGWWSSTEFYYNNAGSLSVSSDYEWAFQMPITKTMGFSVRCIKDESDTTISTKLTGGTSKAWVVDASIPAHFGVGPWDNSSVIPAWYAAQVNEKLSCCPCFYTSKFTFTKVDDANYTLTVATPDGAYTKTGVLAGGLPGIPATGDEACYSYAGGTSDFSLIPSSSGIQAPTSTKTSILLKGVNTFIGYGATQKEYEILQITDTTLYLRVQGTEPGFAWYLKLKMDKTPIVDLNNTTWDVLINNPSVSWHADVTFYADGTTKYDEPDMPGVYLSYGTWKLTGDKIHWVMDPKIKDAYVFDGTVLNNTMSGTYTFNSGLLTWSAVKKNDSLLIVKSNFTEIDTLQDVYKASNGFIYYLFGKRRVDGFISKINSMSIKRNSNADTTLNFIYDDSLRLSNYYISVKGIRDTSLISFSYSNDSVTVCQYKVNWATGEWIARYKVKLKQNFSKNTYSPYFTEINKALIQSNSSEYNSDAGAIATGIIVIIGGSAIITAVPALTLYYIFGNSIWAGAIGAVGGISYVLDAVTNASASETVNYPIGVPGQPFQINAQTLIQNILTSHTWRKVSETLGSYDNLSGPCESNAVWTFNSNGTLQVNWGGCNITPIYYLKWSIFNNGQSMFMDWYTPYLTNYTITSLSPDKIVIEGMMSGMTDITTLIRN